MAFCFAVERFPVFFCARLKKTNLAGSVKLHPTSAVNNSNFDAANSTLYNPHIRLNNNAKKKLLYLSPILLG